MKRRGCSTRYSASGSLSLRRTTSRHACPAVTINFEIWVNGERPKVSSTSCHLALASYQPAPELERHVVIAQIGRRRHCVTSRGRGSRRSGTRVFTSSAADKLHVRRMYFERMTRFAVAVGPFLDAQPPFNINGPSTG